MEWSRVDCTKSTLFFTCSERLLFMVVGFHPTCFGMARSVSFWDKERTSWDRSGERTTTTTLFLHF